MNRKNTIYWKTYFHLYLFYINSITVIFLFKAIIKIISVRKINYFRHLHYSIIR